MKNIILIIISILIANKAFSLDLNAALEKIGTNPEIIRAQGKKIVLGEITGIGKQIDINRVEIFILDNDAILKSEITRYNISRINSLPTLAHLVSIQVGKELIYAQEIKGAVIP